MTGGLGELIGRGRTAEVYAWSEGRVLKLFFPSRPRTAVEAEAQATRIAHEAGVGTPAIGEIIEVDGRGGIVLERIDGPSMLAQLVTHPWQLRRLARQMAELQAAVHACRAPELRSLRDVVRWELSRTDLLDAAVKETILQRLDRLPDGDSLCHGDLYPDNIIVSPRGPVVIDWSAGRRGNPLADVARSSLIIRMAELPADTKGRWLLRPVLRIVGAAFYAFYLRRYRQLRPFADEELAAWQLPMVALRLVADNIPEERRPMMEYINRALDDRTV